MEIASPYPKASIFIINNPNTTHKTDHLFNNCNFNTAICKSPIQTNLSLQRPIRKKKRPQLIKPAKKPTTANGGSTITVGDVLRLMDALKLNIPSYMYVSLVKECTDTRDAVGAVELHDHVDQSRITPYLPLLNRILLMYVSCGCMENARELFDEMSAKDSNSWAVMMVGYTHNEDYEEAVDLFMEMQKYHYNNTDILGFPGSWIPVCILKACEHTNEELGSQIHARLLKTGCSKDLFLCSSLINFYGKIGCLKDADFVFDQMPGRNSTVIWTARMVNYCKEKRYHDVINLFKEMGKKGVKKNSFTFSSVLKACANMRDDGYCGRQVHVYVIKLGLISKRYVQSALVNMYGKFGLLREARGVFEASGEKRNGACWSAMLTVYIRSGFCVEAIKILYGMKAAGLPPHESLLNEVMCVCGNESESKFLMK